MSRSTLKVPSSAAYSYQLQSACQAVVVAAFRFLRQPSRPKAPRPVAKRGRAAPFCRGRAALTRPARIRLTILSGRKIAPTNDETRPQGSFDTPNQTRSADLQAARHLVRMRDRKKPWPERIAIAAAASQFR